LRTTRMSSELVDGFLSPRKVKMRTAVHLETWQ
jgi:hypothetical protein